MRAKLYGSVFNQILRCRDFEIAGSFNFKCNYTLCPAELWIRIDENSHDVPIDDVGEHIAVRNDLDLVPLARLD